VIDIKEEPDIEVEVTIDKSAEGTADNKPRTDGIIYPF
jgi:hypothetical protein